MSAQTGQNRLGPSVRTRAGRTQAATWAWAGKAPRAPPPAWAGELAQRIAAVRVDPTAERLFRADQNAAAADALETLGIRLFPSLSPRCLPLLSRSGDGHRRAAASEEKPERALAPSLAPSPARVLPNG